MTIPTSDLHLAARHLDDYKGLKSAARALYAKYVQQSAGADCLTTGCRARRMCPVGREFIYEPFQAQFHMEAFLAARLAD